MYKSSRKKISGQCYFLQTNLKKKESCEYFHIVTASKQKLVDILLTNFYTVHYGQIHFFTICTKTFVDTSSFYLRPLKTLSGAEQQDINLLINNESLDFSFKELISL